MAPSPPESPRLEILESARSISPPVLRYILPLRIVKHSDSGCSRPDPDLDDHAPRKCSQGTDESRGSVPEPPGGERQLTIPKIRGHRNIQYFDSRSDEVDESPVPLGRKAYISKRAWESRASILNASSLSKAAPEYTGYNTHRVPTNQVLSLGLCYSPNSRDGHTVDSFRSRHSPRLRGRAYTKSDVGFRDQFAFLTSKRTVPAVYRPFPGFMSIIQRSGTADSFPYREPSALPPCDHYRASDDPFTSPIPLEDYDLTPSASLLVPIVRVTPDKRVIDTGYHNFWVAVQVTADLYQSGNLDGDSPDNNTPRSQKSSRSAEIGEICQNTRMRRHTDRAQVQQPTGFSMIFK